MKHSKQQMYMEKYVKSWMTDYRSLIVHSDFS